jgi:hypothetical protein
MISITTVNAATGEVVEHEITEEEKAEIDVISNEVKAIQDEIESKNVARQSALAKLAALGLTEEEIAAL